MKKTEYDEYPEYKCCIPESSFGAIYPLSIAEQIQSGDIFTDGSSLLFWHKCGFGYIYGKSGEAFLDEIYKNFLSEESSPERRFVLFTDSEAEKNYFSDKSDLKIGRRYFFEYPGNSVPQARPLPEGMELHEIDDELFDKCDGRIVPLFSWEDKESFLQRGKGFCVTDGERVAACAFSSAVSSREIDIGVETAEGYRKRGLAYIAARAVIDHALSTGKCPVWACSNENEGSRRLAESLGFVKTAECYTIGRH